MRVLFILLLCGLSLIAQAQNTATASQTIELVINPILDIKFSNTGSSNGDKVVMGFDTKEQYKKGVTSATQQIEVSSNQKFKISVQTTSSTFAYRGAEANANMPVDNSLFVAVMDNNTGGKVAQGFNNNYHALSSNMQDLILNGKQGESQKFALAYMAKPEIGYPTGSYSVDVMYTATQP